MPLAVMMVHPMTSAMQQKTGITLHEHSKNLCLNKQILNSRISQYIHVNGLHHPLNRIDYRSHVKIVIAPVECTTTYETIHINTR